MEKCRQKIPNPVELEQRLKELVEAFADAPDPKTKEPLFSQECWKQYQHLIAHVRQSCLSDLEGFNYYYHRTTASGKTVLMCLRGTSQNEGFHAHVRTLIQGNHLSPELAIILLAVFINRWNIDRGIERGLIPAKYEGLYELHIVEEIKSMVRDDPLFDERVHEDFVSSSDFGDTGESFYTPAVKSYQSMRPGTKKL